MTGVKRIRDLLVTFMLASGSAAFVAYSMARVAHYSLGISSSDLRNQALMSAVVLIGFVTVEFIWTKEP